MYQGSENIYQIATGGSYTDYFYADGHLISQKTGSSGNPTYDQEDNLRSTRLVTTSNGDIQFSSDYIPFGSPFGSTGTSMFTYIGDMMDTEVGSEVYYADARYLDSSTGRFMSEDPESGDLEDPMSLNRYIYADDNPMTMTDPTGNMPLPYTLHYQTSQNENNFLDILVSDFENVINSISGNAKTVLSNTGPPDSGQGGIVFNIADAKHFVYYEEQEQMEEGSLYADEMGQTSFGLQTTSANGVTIQVQPSDPFGDTYIPRGSPVPPNTQSIDAQPRILDLPPGYRPPLREDLPSELDDTPSPVINPTDDGDDSPGFPPDDFDGFLSDIGGGGIFQKDM